MRLVGQFGDGVFQASLAGAVLFDPQRAGHASDVAAAFAVLLLPYSVLGPFAGVLLDRWWRQRVLTVANAARGLAVLGLAAELAAGVRGVAFYASGLVLMSVARFVLSALSAAQPRVVDPADLVTANALSSTLGTVAAALGGGAALGMRAAIGSGDAEYALIAALAAVPYVVAALVAARFATSSLGPSEQERAKRETPREVARGLAAGARAVHRIPLVESGLAVIGVHRLLYGIWTVCTVLLYRNHFAAHGVFRTGLAGLSQIVAGIAVGSALASFVTPAAFRRLGAAVWPGAMLAACAVVELATVTPYRLPLMLLSALLLSFGSQAVKLSVDTTIQQLVDDGFRGRVFALYDMVFNVALVVAAALTAMALPEDGRSPTSTVLLAIGWLVAGCGYLTRALGPARALRTSS